MTQAFSPAEIIPASGGDSVFVGRVWDPSSNGPRVCAVKDSSLVDLTPAFPTVSCAMEKASTIADAAHNAPNLFSLDEVVAGSHEGANSVPHLLAPIDLQVVKACGVTFVGSMIERVIEEKCAGDPARAQEVREQISSAIGGSLRGVKPGSPRAEAVKEILVEQGVWSAYLEVGIGPDPEVFTKAPVLSSVGYGAKIGIPSFSSWNNPEPELVLIVNSQGQPVGATLGNDVNLRDVEGRSSLLLGKAKDNNASSSLGPFIRVFDSHFGMEGAAEEEIRLEVIGTDGYTLEGVNSVREISRPLSELVGATWGAHHQYPDGFALFTGTLFAPTQDRDIPGGGFTHKPGDRVRISSAHLGVLENVTAPTESLAPWTWGIREQFAYLQQIQGDH